MKKLNIKNRNEHITDQQTKDTGSIYTPTAIVDKLLGYMPYDRLLDNEQWFIEPCAGTGNIVLGILDRRVALGVKPDIALSHIIANELLEETYNILKQRLKYWATSHNIDESIVDERCFNMDMWKFFDIMRESQCSLSCFLS